MIFWFNIETTGWSNPQKVVGHPRDSLYTCRPRPFTGHTFKVGPKELLPGAPQPLRAQNPSSNRWRYQLQALIEHLGLHSRKNRVTFVHIHIRWKWARRALHGSEYCPADGSSENVFFSIKLEKDRQIYHYDLQRLLWNYHVTITYVCRHFQGTKLSISNSRRFAFTFNSDPKSLNRD